MPVLEELSTQAAADLLGLSRQFFVRECGKRANFRSTIRERTGEYC